MRSVLLGFLVGCLWTAASASAQVEPVITYEYYPVTPELGRSLHNQLLTDTPLRHEGRKAYGLARSPIRLSYQIGPAAAIGLCRIRNLSVTCHCEVSLPQLQSDDPGLNSDFNAYLALLKDHELTHCRISAAFAGRFQEKLLAWGARPCPSLENEVKAAFDQMTAERRRDQERFDHNTRMGGYQSRKARILLDLPQRAGAPGDRALSNLPEPDKEAFWSGPAEGGPETGAIYKGQDGVWRNY